MDITNNLVPSTNPYVFFDIKFKEAKAGRVVIELFKDRVPRACENFRALCTGEKGIGKLGKPLHFKGSVFHRVVPICMVQGGDIIRGDGTSGESIYGESFDDEESGLQHNEPGIVGMTNNGPNSNLSQFYITTVPCPHLDDINMIVGKVVRGLNILVEMADIPRENDIPLEKIWIENCGEYKPGEPFNIGERDGTEDVYPPWPNDWELNPLGDAAIMEEVVTAIKNSGNHFYMKQNYIDSERKYIKTLRYIDWYLCNKRNYNYRKSIEGLRFISMLNLAAVKIKRHKYKEAVELCDEVLKHRSGVGKAYYRRGQARFGLKDYDKALDDLNTAIGLIPNDRHILDVLRTTKRCKLAYLKREKRLFARMFN